MFMCYIDKLEAEALAALDTSVYDIKTSLSCACMQVPNDGDASLLTEDYLYNLFRFPVNKAEALAYLDAGGPLPVRYAKVIAVRGAHSPPDVMEYKVNCKKTTPQQGLAAHMFTRDGSKSYVPICTRKNVPRSEANCARGGVQTLT